LLRDFDLGIGDGSFSVADHFIEGTPCAVTQD
jgi:hypothetical protein